MSRDITCAMCSRAVDNADTVEMPQGLVCLDPCYSWLERMMDEINEDDDDEVIFVIGLEDEEEDDDDDDEED